MKDVGKGAHSVRALGPLADFTGYISLRSKCGGALQSAEAGQRLKLTDHFIWTSNLDCLAHAPGPGSL